MPDLFNGFKATKPRCRTSRKLMQIVTSPVRQENAEAGQAQQGSIRIKGVNKAYQEGAPSSVLALEEINLNLPANSFVSLLGRAVVESLRCSNSSPESKGHQAASFIAMRRWSTASTPG